MGVLVFIIYFEYWYKDIVGYVSGMIFVVNFWLNLVVFCSR